MPNNTSDCETVNMAIHAVYKVAVSICIIQLSVAAATSCNIGTVARCDNITDDTAAIQAVLDTCSRDMQLIVFPGNRTCLTQPLNLSSHTAIWFEPSAVLRAGDKDTWDRTTPGRTMITAENITNVTITGHGTLDGAGAQWWHSGPQVPCMDWCDISGQCSKGQTCAQLTEKYSCDKYYQEGQPYAGWCDKTCRVCAQLPKLVQPLELPSSQLSPKLLKPVLMQFHNTTDVVLSDFTLLNAARQHLGLYGARYRVSNLTVQCANVISTDGVGIGAIDAHLSGLDITNGDDCIAIKKTAQNVLIENSVVRQGHGLVVGTTGDPNIRNITFRNILVNGTMDGCKIKFKDEQHGSVSDVHFENITLVQVARYAMGIDSEIRDKKPEKGGTRVTINNITFSSIRGSAQDAAGHFSCKTGPLACKGIVVEGVNITAPRGCFFNNTFGSGVQVYPGSCVPPTNDGQRRVA